MSMKKDNYSFGKTALRVIFMPFKAAPLVTNISNVLLMIMALAEVALVICTQNLFDTITHAAAGQTGFWDCAVPLLILTVVTVGQGINNGVYWFLIDVIHGKCVGKFNAMLFHKLQRINPACFEETDFLDDINKSKEGVFILTYFCLLSYALVFNYLVYFVAIGAYLFMLKPILIITLLLFFLPSLLAQFFRIKVFTNLEQENAPLRREYEYYQKTLCDREYFKETRILGAYKHFHKLFSDTMRLLTRKTWQTERKTALLQLLLNIMDFAGMAISTYLLFNATMAGEISVGAFAAVFASLGIIFSWMQTLVTHHIGNMTRDFGKVYNFIRVADMPEQTGADGTSDFTKGIATENISFTYPGRDEPAVRDVSLKIANGETIAIVGENGAGKSTLVRLLTGIYCPSDGKVMVGGLDTAKTAPVSIYKGISGVFQKYQRYKMTLGENITISGTNAEVDNVRIETVLKEADFNGDSITLDTMLSPEFDGIDLSGGQWQRLAIARGLYRQNGFIVLDEPTSAIDPIEETRIYTQFQRLAEGKCAVVVTHRLGSAKLAHRIIVMDAGQIVDTGTHEELLSRTGKYADMWAAQAKWYDREAN